MPQLEPRSFSFNSPYGACPACNGLGSKYDFDPAKVIVDWTRPLFEGGLGPGSGSAILKRTLELAAYAHGFDLATPFEKFPAAQQNLILYGNPPFNQPDAATKAAASTSVAAKKSKSEKGFRFPGILGFLDRNFQESNSDAYREWITQYMSAPRLRGLRRQAPAPGKPGRESRRPLHRRFHRAVASAAARPAVDQIPHRLTQRQRDVAGRPLAEIAERLDFLLAVGLGYLSLDRSAATLSGGEAQRIRLATQIGSRLRGVLYVLDEPSIGLHARDNDRLISARSNNCATSATPCSSSSTTKKPFAAPTTSSTSAPARATPAAISSPKARPNEIAAQSRLAHRALPQRRR